MAPDEATGLRWVRTGSPLADSGHAPLATQMTANCYCGTPAPNAWLCQVHDLELTQLVAELPALTGYLLDTVTGQVRFSGGRIGGRSAETPLVVNMRASETAGLVRNTLVGIIRHLVETRGVSPRRLPGDDLIRMATWVAVHVDSIRMDETASEILFDMRAIRSTIARVIDRPPDRVYAGICSIDHGGHQCPEELYATRDATFITCRRCGYRHDVKQRQSVLQRAARDMMLTIPELKVALPEVLGVPINHNTLRSWKARKRILPHGQTDDGDDLFNVGEILDLVLQQHTERAS